MISALRKIENRGELTHANSAVMEMCIDNPRDGFANLFDTHPPIDARVAALVKVCRRARSRAAAVGRAGGAGIASACGGAVERRTRGHRRIARSLERCATAERPPVSAGRVTVIRPRRWRPVGAEAKLNLWNDNTSFAMPCDTRWSMAALERGSGSGLLSHRTIRGLFAQIARQTAHAGTLLVQASFACGARPPGLTVITRHTRDFLAAASLNPPACRVPSRERLRGRQSRQR